MTPTGPDTRWLVVDTITGKIIASNLTQIEAYRQRDSANITFPKQDRFIATHGE